MERPENVYREVRYILSLIDSDHDFRLLDRVFSDTVALYRGGRPGYRPCNTAYHDLRHTCEVLLTLSRLIHGMNIGGLTISNTMTQRVLLSALMHDTGYIQTADDKEGTGSKYTSIHVERSIEYMRRYFEDRDYPLKDFEACSRIVAATHQSMSLADIAFASEEEKLMAQAIYTSDFLGQMADRYYLEKLFFLFGEFVEGGVPGIRHEDDLFHNTVNFCEIIQQRLSTEMGYSPDFMRNHFRHRWNMDRDLYTESVVKNITYLKYLMDCCRRNYRDMLRRGGIVKTYERQMLQSV